jgi:protein SCO1/2
MPARLRLTLMVVGTIALAAIALVALVAAGDEAADGSSAQRFEGSVRPDGIPPAQFAGLRDERGRPVRLADLRGRPAVVTFQYTTCEDTCPVTTAQIRGALDDLGHDVPVVAVSVDPPRDTPDRAQRFLTEQRMTGRMRWALGDTGDLQRLWRAYGVQPQSDRAEHSASTVLIDKRGRQRVGYATDVLTPETLAHDIGVLEAEAR